MVNRKYKYFKKKGRKNSLPNKKFNYAKRSHNLAKDVSKLQKVVKGMSKSVEVKRSQELGVSSNVVGQVNVNNTGALCITATLNTGDGVDMISRIGEKIKLIGYSIRGQIAQQTLASTPCRVLVEVWKTQDVVTSPISNHLNYLFNADTISGVIDINSTRVAAYLDTYKRVFAKNYYIGSDTVSGVAMLKDFKIFIKQKQMLHYIGTSAVEPSNIRYLITVRCSTGNCNTSTNSTLPNLANTGATTGLYFRCVSNMFFTDL